MSIQWRVHDGSNTSDPETQEPGTQDRDTQDQDTQDQDTQDFEAEDFPKKKLVRTRQESAIMKVAQRIFEDTWIFENPFPTPHQDCTAIYDAWKSTSKQCKVKGAIRNINGELD